jgi:surface-anchored protein
MTTRRGLLAVPVVVLACLVAACSPPPGPSPTTTTTTTTTTTVPKHIMSVGHADVFEVSVSGTSLSVQIEDESVAPTVYRSPAQTLLQVRPTAQTSVPSPAGNFSFLGAAGAPVWILPQVQNPALLWPGSSTERIGAGVLQGNALTWRIDSVSGPGGFHLYTTNGFGQPSVVFTTNAALPQSTSLTVPSHAHYNWAFGATGTYTVVMRATATLAGGLPVTTGPVAYTFRVGPL